MLMVAYIIKVTVTDKSGSLCQFEIHQSCQLAFIKYDNHAFIVIIASVLHVWESIRLSPSPNTID